MKVGDKVKWICKPFFSEPFECIGYIEKLKKSTFGSTVKGTGATILVSTDNYIKSFHKRRAFVNTKNLTVIKLKGK